MLEPPSRKRLPSPPDSPLQLELVEPFGLLTRSVAVTAGRLEASDDAITIENQDRFASTHATQVVAEPIL